MTIYGPTCNCGSPWYAHLHGVSSTTNWSYRVPVEPLQLWPKPFAHVNCWCVTCEEMILTARTMNGDQTAWSGRQFIACPDCGNKRCPRAAHHDRACTGSNEPGQPGSAYPLTTPATTPPATTTTAPPADDTAAASSSATPTEEQPTVTAEPTAEPTDIGDVIDETLGTETP